MGDEQDESARKGNISREHIPRENTLAARGADDSGGLAAGGRESGNTVDDHPAAAAAASTTKEDDAESSGSRAPAISSSATDIDLLRAENALLRLALEEAQHQLRLVGGDCGQNGSSTTTVVPTSREPRNGGVAYARMRRLLLKDDGFLRDSFLPFLNVEDLGRCGVTLLRACTIIATSTVVS